VKAFLAADRLSPSPALSFNIARAYQKLDDASGALRWYRDYLRRAPDASNRSEVRELVGSLDAALTRRGLQQITILSSPMGANVTVDGHSVGATPYTGDLTIGEHRLTLSAADYDDEGVDLMLTASAPQDLNINLKRASANGSASPKPAEAPRATPSPTTRDLPAPETESTRPMGVAPYIVTGAGVVLLGGALGLELARRSQQSQAEDSQTQIAFQNHVDHMEDLKTSARIMLGVGIAGVATGSVLMILNQKRESPSPVAFGCFTDGCSASARGTF
jgi:hypothetical protein